MKKDKIISGTEFAHGLRAKIAAEVKDITAKTGKKPGLAVILVGDDPASEVYVRNKSKQTIEVGMENFEYKLPVSIREEQLIAKINELNNDPKVHGILVQLPLPQHISELAVINAISPEKDVDGFTAINRGRLTAAHDCLIPCTPLGCIMLIKDRLGNDISGLNAVVVGRSNIVGKPMSQILLNEGCTVTTCHSKTKDIKSITRTADILVVAVGKPELIDASWVKEGVCVIDVGINRVQDVDATKVIPSVSKPKLVGDVNYASVEPVAGFITPVPGGVGPMTIACLLNNTLKAFRSSEKI